MRLKSGAGIICLSGNTKADEGWERLMQMWEESLLPYFRRFIWDINKNKNVLIHILTIVVAQTHIICDGRLNAFYSHFQCGGLWKKRGTTLYGDQHNRASNRFSSSSYSSSSRPRKKALNVTRPPSPLFMNQ